MPTLPDLPPPFGRAAPVPGWLRGPLNAVLRDLQRPTPIRLAVGWTEDAGLLWLQVAGEAFGLIAVHVTRGGFGDVAVALAEQLQDELVETRAAWGEARPACPGHRHPAEAGLEGRVAWWFCPVTGEALRRVGKG